VVRQRCGGEEEEEEEEDAFEGVDFQGVRWS
jgi:hypothetical protein